MTAKEYLMQIHNLDTRIKNIDDEIKDLRNEIITVRSSWPDGQVHGSDTTSPVEEAVVALVDGIKKLETEQLMLRSELWSTRNQIIQTIGQVTRPEHNRLLYLRYVQGKMWEEIAVEMHYTYQWVAGPLHSNALNEVQQILDRN